LRETSPRELWGYRMTMSEAVPSVLFVADDPATQTEVAAFLQADGMHVRTVNDGTGALALVTDDWRPDLIVVDLLLSTHDTYVVCRLLRGAFGAPIVVSTPFRGRFSGEADHVMPRPLDVAHLAASIRVLLAAPMPSVEVIRAGDLIVMPRAERAFLAGRELSVNADEVALLTRLAATAGRAVRKDDLRGALRGVGADTDPRIVDVHLVRLMVKLEGAASVRLRRTPANDAYILSIMSARDMAVPA